MQRRDGIKERKSEDNRKHTPSVSAVQKDIWLVGADEQSKSYK